MDPEQLEAFIAFASREELGDHLRQVYLACRCGTEAFYAALPAMPTVPLVSLASG